LKPLLQLLCDLEGATAEFIDRLAAGQSVCLFSRETQGGYQVSRNYSHDVLVGWSRGWSGQRAIDHLVNPWRWYFAWRNLVHVAS